MVSRAKVSNIVVCTWVVCIAHGRGSSRAISKSNKRNVIATRKNFIENGRRADPVGSNPHSYESTFSVYEFS